MSPLFIIILVFMRSSSPKSFKRRSSVFVFVASFELAFVLILFLLSEVEKIDRRHRTLLYSLMCTVSPSGNYMLTHVSTYARFSLLA
eukprot:scaffold342_cov95-Skeletonema_dohrnii-CCMP3373.AAC.1